MAFIGHVVTLQPFMKIAPSQQREEFMVRAARVIYGKESQELEKSMPPHWPRARGTTWGQSVLHVASWGTSCGNVLICDVPECWHG